jgi:hypothetical protein
MHRITKAALALAALPAAGLALASPASAHGTTQHTVALSGSLHIVDYDTGADTTCNVTFLDDDTAQLPSDPQVNLGATRACDEVRVLVNASGTLSSTGAVTISGTVEAQDEDCFLSCGFDEIGTRSFSRTLAPLGSSTVTGTIDDGRQGSVTFTLALSNSE